MSNYEDRHPKDFLTNDAHGGKITCHKCNGFIIQGEEYRFDTDVWFHKKCFSKYEHCYGLDKPLD